MKGTIVDITNVSFLAVVGSPAARRQSLGEPEGGLQENSSQPPLLPLKPTPWIAWMTFPTHQMLIVP